MNLLVSAHENYYYPLLVTLYSFLVNNSYEHHYIYFVYGTISDKYLSEMKHFIEKGNRATLITHRVDESSFAQFPLSYHFSIETYYRFLAQDILPAQEDRVLWIDADMIVKKSLKDFYYQDFEDCYLVVCPSINEKSKELIEKLGCPEGTVYFNAGTILFNLHKIREHITFQSYYQYYQTHKDQITWLDQDILNGIYAKKTKIADNRLYNCQFFNNTQYTSVEKQFIEENTVILHYIGELKPWHDNYTNEFCHYWRRYARKALPLKKRTWTKLGYLNHKVKSSKAYRYFGGIYRKAIRIIQNFINNKEIFNTIVRKRILILGTPEHTNLGDSAIVISEIVFLKKCGIEAERIGEITVNEYLRNNQTVIRAIHANKQQVVCWHGGGNMGDQWIDEEYFRRQAMRELTKPMIIFPQTIYYSDSEKGIEEKSASIAVYNDRADLTVVAREKKSYEIMRRLYPDTEIILTPDIVLSADMEQFGVVPQERHGVLLCLRNDPEKSVSDENWERLELILDGAGMEHRRTDMYSEQPVTKLNRQECVRQKMQEFCGASLVITDRLHGMVFAAITGTPCIVFSNYNHKVRGTYEWIKYLPYIKYAETVEDAELYIPELLAMDDCQYDNAPLMPYFVKLKEVVIAKCQR